jgi:iron complex outermembrane receptor protein
MSMFVRQVLMCSSALGVMAASAAHAQGGGPSKPTVAPTAAADAPPVNAPPAVAPATTPTASDAPPALNQILVTGTRLPGFNAPTPVTALGAAEIQQRVPANILEVINQIPAARPTFQTAGNVRNSTTQNSIQGAVDLRGLGPTRTLVLFNGQRFVAGGFLGTPDTNMFPVSLIQRIDVVTGGASAAYGSDAVAGVVNFIFDNKYEGLKASIQGGISEFSDLKQFVASLGAGKSFDDGRLHVVVGLDAARNNGSGTVYARPWGSIEPSLVGTGAVGSATRPAGTPAQIWVTNAERADASRGGLIVSGPLRGTAFDASGSPIPFQFGTLYGTQMVGSTSNYGFNNQGFTTIGNPFKRVTAYSQVTYDLNDKLSVWASGNLGYVYDRTFGSPPYQAPPTGGSYIISINNPYLPAATRAAMIQNGLTTINVSKFIDVLGKTGGVSQTAHTYKLWRYAAGIKGEVFPGWDIDGYFTQGRTKELINFLYAPMIANMAAAVNAVRDPVTGQIVCGPIATNPNLNATTRTQVEPGCVPYNIFGVTPFEANEAAYRYMTHPVLTDIISKQSAFGADLRGHPFSTWAGPAAFAVGVEWRKDALALINTDYSTQITPLVSQGGQVNFTGENTVKEAFAEIGIPLARESGPGLYGLDVNGAGRITHYDIGGTVKTWKVGATWDPIPEVRFRITRSQDIRAPNVYDLFGKGAPQPFVNAFSPFTGRTSNVLFSISGNRSLKPEIAQTLTAGIVLKPGGFLRGFRASVDYFDIKIKDVVATVAVPEVIQRCFNGEQLYCSAITFDPTAPLGFTLVNTIPANLAQLATKGFDFEADYRVHELPVGIPGSLNFRFLGTWTKKMAVTTSGGTISYVGTSIVAPAGGGVPAFKGNLTIDYDTGRFRTGLQFVGFTHLKMNPTFVGPDDPNYNPNASNSISKNLFPGMIYTNLTGSYRLHGWGQPEVFWSVNNLLGIDPPKYALVAFSFNQANYYDIVGRYYQAGVRFAFK